MKYLQKCLLLSMLSMMSLIAFGTDMSAEEPAAPIRVLILTGHNNHKWQTTTPMLQQILKSSGKFKVDTTVPPKGLTSENLKKYDVILSDWNSWGRGSKETEAAWTDATRKAYLDFVREGKGHVTVHAGGSSFYKSWPEYRKVALVYWELGATGHDRQHVFKVRIDKPDHPLMAGLKGFTIHDELWNKPGVVEGATVLASAYSDKEKGARGTNEWEPSVVTAPYGKGRCFATLLGHDAKIMENKDFQTLLIRGVEWAATGKVVPTVKSEPK